MDHGWRSGNVSENDHDRESGSVHDRADDCTSVNVNLPDHKNGCENDRVSGRVY